MHLFLYQCFYSVLIMLLVCDITFCLFWKKKQWYFDGLSIVMELNNGLFYDLTIVYFEYMFGSPYSFSIN